MPRPSNWKTPTTAIRVPEHLVEHLITIAKTLDEMGFVQNPEVAIPQTMVTVDGEQYLSGGVTLSRADAITVEKMADIAYAEIAHLKRDKQLWILGELAKHWGEPHG